jgi:hypothetical protein
VDAGYQHISQNSKKVTFADVPVVREKRNELLDSTMADHFTPQTKQDGMK